MDQPDASMINIIVTMNAANIFEYLNALLLEHRP